MRTGESGGWFLTQSKGLSSQVVQWQESACQCRRHKRLRFSPWVRKIPWSRKWQPTSVFLPGKFLRQRSLAGHSSWGHKESYTTEQLNNKWLSIHSRLGTVWTMGLWLCFYTIILSCIGWTLILLSAIKEPKRKESFGNLDWSNRLEWDFGTEGGPEAGVLCIPGRDMRSLATSFHGVSTGIWLFLPSVYHPRGSQTP